jgi:ParB-like chromosome segregation protein Spo0J
METLYCRSSTPHALRCHERVSRKRVARLKRDIRARGVREPLLVDYASFVVLDGHHRLHALHELGARRAPVFFVDYSHPVVRVRGRRKRVRVSKKLVVARARRGKLFPPKTTRHEFAARVRVPRAKIALKKLF